MNYMPSRTVLKGTLAAAALAALASCTPPPIRSTLARPPSSIEMAELWQDPADIATRDLFYGPGGAELAPDPHAIYAFVKEKTQGVSPGFTVRDPAGTEWSAKQGEEAKLEVVASRILWAVGYHQPPVYYLPRWTLAGGPGERTQSEARFRPKVKTRKELGEWSWQQNPFVGTRPYAGLLVLMMILNESDLKSSNNSIYEVRDPAAGVHQWYVVRDLGTAFGETGKLDPKRGDPRLFEEQKFIRGVKNGYVEFAFHGLHGELVTNRIRPDDVVWMCKLLSRLTPAQWRDAFRAGNVDPAGSERFIRKIQEKIEQGRAIASSAGGERQD